MPPWPGDGSSLKPGPPCPLGHPGGRAPGLPVPPRLPLLAKAKPGAHTWLTLGRGSASRKESCQLSPALGTTPHVPAGMGWDQVMQGTGPQAVLPREAPSLARSGCSPRPGRSSLANGNTWDKVGGTVRSPRLQVKRGSRGRSTGGGALGAAASILASSLSPVLTRCQEHRKGLANAR